MLVTWVSYGCGLTLLLLVLSALMSTAGREYRSMLVYISFLMLSIVSDVSMLYVLGPKSTGFYYYSWFAELIRQTCQLAFVITLVYRAFPDGRFRTALMRFVVLGTLALWVGSILIYQDPKLTIWLGKVVRNVSFSAALINLILWFTLIAGDRRDTRLLMISGGLGIQMTGDAMGQSLRTFPSLLMLGNVVSIAAYFLCLAIWWQAFRPRKPALGS